MLDPDERETMESVGLESIYARPTAADLNPPPPERTASKDKSDGWFPGKYLPVAMAFRSISEKLKDKEEAPARQVQDPKLADRIQEELRLTDSGELEEEEKKENLIVATVRGVREKFLERRIVGKIYLSRMSGVVATALTSDITEEDIAGHLQRQSARSRSGEAADPLLHAELTGQYKRAMSITDTILNSLERRSLTWANTDFNVNTMLTRGTTLGVSDPFLGLINFSFTLQLSGTTSSLLASRRRFEAARELALSRVVEEGLFLTREEDEDGDGGRGGGPGEICGLG